MHRLWYRRLFLYRRYFGLMIRRSNYFLTFLQYKFITFKCHVHADHSVM